MNYAHYAACREARGLKDADVSKATGIRQGVFSDWKNARYTPKLDKLLKITKLFGMSLDELIRDEAE